MTTGRQNAFGLLMSLNMLIETHGRVRYTGSRLPQPGSREAGFRESPLEHLLGPKPMVVGVK